MQQLQAVEDSLRRVEANLLETTERADKSHTENEVSHAHTLAMHATQPKADEVIAMTRFSFPGLVPSTILAAHKAVFFLGASA